MTPQERDDLVRDLVLAMSVSRKEDLQDLKDEMILRFGDHEPRIVKLEEFHGAAKTVGSVSMKIGGVVAGIAGFLKLIGII